MKLLGAYNSRRPLAFTLIELLVVIGIASMLIALLFAALSKLRSRTKRGQAITLVEKVANAVEAYHFAFRAYPPFPPAAVPAPPALCTPAAVGATYTGPDGVGRTASQTLNYLLTTAFRVSPSPDPAKHEAQATVDAGPFLTVDERDLANPAASDGVLSIVDPWQTPLYYYVDQRPTVDPFDNTKWVITVVPVLYSHGVNKQNDTLPGYVPAGDDIGSGGK